MPRKYLFFQRFYLFFERCFSSGMIQNEINPFVNKEEIWNSLLALYCFFIAYSVIDSIWRESLIPKIFFISIRYIFSGLNQASVG